MTKVIMHIDYDSFFASVEQQANPFIRNKPVIVTGSSIRRGIACAASKEAKKLGIKTATPVFKAKQICPNIIVVKGDGTKYTYIHKQSLKIFNKYTDLVEPFSIDEAFLDVSDTLKFFGSIENVANSIKKDIKNKFGEYITCSIGVAPNKLIAKLVSEINKPNGLFIANEKNLEKILQNISLRDFCGIGHKIEIKLNKLGVYNVSDLQKIDINILYNEFGNVSGSFLKNASLGISYDNVSHISKKRKPKSISHQHTLYKNTKNKKIIKSNITRLATMVVSRLRKHNMKTSKVSLWIRDSNKISYGENISISRYIDTNYEIFKIVNILFDKLYIKIKTKEIRLVAIGLSDLKEKNNISNTLFIEDVIQERLNQTIDDINNRFGRFTIVQANTLLADTTKTKISSFLKHN